MRPSAPLIEMPPRQENCQSADHMNGRFWRKAAVRAQAAPRISGPESSVSVRVVPTDEKSDDCAAYASVARLILTIGAGWTRDPVEKLQRLSIHLIPSRTSEKPSQKSTRDRSQHYSRMRGACHDEQCVAEWSRPQMTGDEPAELQSAVYDALMNDSSNQSRFHIAPGTSSARRPALKPYEPQKWKPHFISGRPHMFDHDSIPARKWPSNLPVAHRVGHSVLPVDNEATDDVADIYNQAGDDYVSYADGDPSQPFAFDGMHAYADRCVWAVLEKKLTDLRASGASSVRLLDAGCGPGTWLRRLVMRAHALGFSGITARGFDIAQAQIQRARLAARTLSSLPGVNLTFDVADLADRLPEADASVDSLPLQRAQPSACCTLARYLKGDRTRHVGIFHNDGPSDWQHSNGLCRLDRESPPIETRSRQGPLRNRPQRRPTYCI
jgi:SAM-dependent methyltransferase